MEWSFKKNLRDELDYQNIMVKELSAMTKIPKPTLDCYLSSRQTMPPADIAVKIAQALHVSVEYLVTGQDANVVPRDYEDFQPYRMIIEELKKLDEESVSELHVMIRALAKYVVGKKSPAETW